MKHRAVLCLIAVTMFAAGAAASVAHAQDSVTVTVTNTVNATVSAGATVTDAGDCTIQNTSTTDTITINSVTYTVGTPGLFASTTLTVNGIPQAAAPPSFTNSPAFSVAIAPSSSVTCGMSAVISTNPSSTERLENLRPAFASAFGPATGASNRAAGVLLMAALAMLVAAGQLRRRHLVVLALAMILAATEAACGNTHNSSVVGASSQKITAMSATSNRGVAVTFSGLPAIMGTLTVQ